MNDDDAPVANIASLGSGSCQVCGKPLETEKQRNGVRYTVAPTDTDVMNHLVAHTPSELAFAVLCLDAHLAIRRAMSTPIAGAGHAEAFLADSIRSGERRLISGEHKESRAATISPMEANPSTATHTDQWKGVLAPMDAPSKDGRVIAVLEGPPTRPLPLPLIDDGDGSFVGSIERVWIEDGSLMGAGRVEPGILSPETPRPVGVDVDDVVTEEGPEGTIVLRRWRLMGARLYATPDRAAFDQSRVALDAPSQ